jgi:hypothetical protein
MPTELGVMVAKIQADVTDLKKGLRTGRQELSSFKNMAETAGRQVKRALQLVGLGYGIYKTMSLIKRGFSEAIEAANEFDLATIGIAATITDMAKAGSRDMRDVFAESLAYATGMYDKLEEAAARFFSSGEDLILAWNILTQKGVVLQEEEIDNLGIIVDRIKLATQGQMANKQIAQEIRSIMDGTAKITDQIAKLLQDRLGPAWKDVVKEVRETGSLKPLADQFKGLSVASEKITDTLESQRSTLRTLLRQVGRSGLQGAYRDIVDLLKSMNDWIRKNKDLVATEMRLAWKSVREMILFCVEAVKILATTIDNLSLGFLSKLPRMVQGLGLYLGDLRKERWITRKADEIYQELLKDESITTRIGMGLTERGRELQEIARATAENWWDATEGVKEHERLLAGLVKPRFQRKGLELDKPADPAAGKKGAKKAAEDILKIWEGFYKAKRDLDIKAAEQGLETFRSEMELRKAELGRQLEAGTLAAEAYYRGINEIEENLSQRALQVLDLKIAKEKEAYEWALKELQARVAKGEVGPEAASIMQKKLLLESQARLTALEAEKIRTRLADERRITEQLREQLENRRKIDEIILDAEAKAAFTEIEQHEAEINLLLKEQEEHRRELIRLLAQQVVLGQMTPAEAGAALGRFEGAAGREQQIAKIGEEAKRWADAVTTGISDLVDSLIEGGRTLKETLNDFFRRLFKESLVPGFKQLQATMEKLFMDLFGAMGKSIANGIMGVIGLVGMLLTGGGGGGSFSPSGASVGVTTHEAVRGIVAGPSSIPIGEIGESLQDALVPTNSILRNIEENTRDLQLTISGEEFLNKLQDVLDNYFANALMTGA